MRTDLIALVIAAALVGGLVLSLGFLSLIIGGVQKYLGKPRLKILKAKHSHQLSFYFNWKFGADQAVYDLFKIRIYNPFGKPTQIEFTRPFAAGEVAFAREIEMGQTFDEYYQADIKDNANVEIEIFSSKDRISHIFEYSYANFKKESEKAISFASEYESQNEPTPTLEKRTGISFGAVTRNMVVEGVPGVRPKLKLATNPEFAGELAQDSGTGTGAAGGDTATLANFAISKVWIAPGCIVCNACETIYPEVFHVTGETCIINNNPPLDNGLKIQEAAEACPVEVIKYTPA